MLITYNIDRFCERRETDINIMYYDLKSEVQRNNSTSTMNSTDEGKRIILFV